MLKILDDLNIRWLPLENGHSFNWINIKIMDHETNYFKRL